MPFQTSPGIVTTEKDLTAFVPGISTSIGGTVGQFVWGPAYEVTTVENEKTLVSLFGKPNSTVGADWFAAANFLSYTNNLQLVRAVSSSSLNGAVEVDSNGARTGTTGIKVNNLSDHESKTSAYVLAAILFAAKYPGAIGNSLKVAWCDATGWADLDTNDEHTWTYAYLFNDAPASGEYHIVVVDEDGLFTGSAGQVLEIFSAVSTTSTAKKYDGTSNYIPSVIDNSSSYVWVGDISLLSGTSNGISLGAGSDGATITDGEREAGFDLFKDSEEVDVSLLFQSAGSKTVGKYMIDNVLETRKDCFGWVSPEKTDVVNVASETTRLNNEITTRTYFGSTSYASMDSVWKQQYDRYNDSYIWVPMNGDMAGLCARTDYTNDPWWSPAGEARGQIKNVVKLSHSQPQAIRDSLYKKNINPVISVKGVGTILYGDKTLQDRPSAFDRINVRRLFITLEKAISKASRQFLFQFNDEFTRAQFVNVVEPFLRDVKGRQGIVDYKVQCDEENNTAEVIDRNEFVADIFIKPNRSINFITLNFVATRSSVVFTESQ